MRADGRQPRRRPTSAASRSRSTSSTAPTPWSRPTTFASAFKPCEPGPFPKKFATGRDDEALPGLPRARQGRPRPRSASGRPRSSTRSPGPASSEARADEARQGQEGKGKGDKHDRLTRFGRPTGARGQWRHDRAHLADPRARCASTTPVVLAPMAGITNAAYRRLCAEQGAGLYVCEMITSRGAGRAATRPRWRCWSSTSSSRCARCSSTAPTRSTSARPPRSSAREYGVAHIDLNFGCPVPKVTRKGGGGALPWKRGLLGADPRARGRRGGAVRRAGDDEDPQGHRRRPPDLPRRRPDRPGVGLRGDRAARPHRRAGLLRRGRLGRDRRAWSTTSTSRCSATATSGRRRTRCGWSSETGAAGVVVGRGCLGRPWLFRDLAAAFAGRAGRHAARPRRGRGDDAPARRAARRSTWGRSAAARSSASTSRGTSRASRPAASCAARWRWSTSLAELDALLARLDPAEPFPVAELGAPARPAGLAARQGRAPRGLARRHRRHRRAASPRTRPRPPAGEIPVTQRSDSRALTLTASTG